MVMVLPDRPRLTISELTGEEEIDSQEENLESVPESEGWDPVPGSTGRQAAESLGEDEFTSAVALGFGAESASALIKALEKQASLEV